MLLSLAVLCKIVSTIIGLAVFMGVLEDVFAPNGWPQGKLSAFVLLEVIGGVFIARMSWKSTDFAVSVMLLAITVMIVWRLRNRQRLLPIFRK